MNPRSINTPAGRNRPGSDATRLRGAISTQAAVEFASVVDGRTSSRHSAIRRYGNSATRCLRLILDFLVRERRISSADETLGTAVSPFRGETDLSAAQESMLATIVLGALSREIGERTLRIADGLSLQMDGAAVVLDTRSVPPYIGVLSDGPAAELVADYGSAGSAVGEIGNLLQFEFDIATAQLVSIASATSDRHLLGRFVQSVSTDPQAAGVRQTLAEIACVQFLSGLLGPERSKSILRWSYAVLLSDPFVANADSISQLLRAASPRQFTQLDLQLLDERQMTVGLGKTPEELPVYGTDVALAAVLQRSRATLRLSGGSASGRSTPVRTAEVLGNSTMGETLLSNVLTSRLHLFSNDQFVGQTQLRVDNGGNAQFAGTVLISSGIEVTHALLVADGDGPVSMGPTALRNELARVAGAQASLLISARSGLFGVYRAANAARSSLALKPSA